MQMWLLLILSQYSGETASYTSENIQRMSVIQSVQHLELSNVLNFYWFSTHLMNDKNQIKFTIFHNCKISV